MEINKKTEQYKIEDVLEEKNWTTQGTIYNNMDGTLSISCSTSLKSGEFVGSVNYSKMKEDTVNINYEISVNNRVSYNNYINSLIDNILEQFK